MKSKATLGVLTALALAAPAMFLGAADVPQTFVTGSIADAEAVNANFLALDSRLDALETAGAQDVCQTKKLSNSVDASTPTHLTALEFNVPTGRQYRVRAQIKTSNGAGVLIQNNTGVTYAQGNTAAAATFHVATGAFFPTGNVIRVYAFSGEIVGFNDTWMEVCQLGTNVTFGSSF